jgi:hypothetical protein
MRVVKFRLKPVPLVLTLVAALVVMPGLSKAASAVDDAALLGVAPQRIGVVKFVGTARVKEGRLSAGWVFQDNDISQFTLATGID